MKYKIILLLLFSILFYGCPADDDMANMGVTGDECDRDIACTGVAVCDDGTCNCPAGFAEIAPKYCVQSADKATFVTYDQYPLIIDTMIIEFEVEPFSHTWQDGDNYYREAIGRVYNRNPFVYGRLPTFIGTLPYPGNPTTPVDTVLIWDIIDKPISWANQYPAGDGYNCKKNFVGAFVDRNTIEGNVFIYNCARAGETVPDSLLPTNIQETISQQYPVTFTRVQ